jgi:hypothetical protein
MRRVLRLCAAACRCGDYFLGATNIGATGWAEFGMTQRLLTKLSTKIVNCFYGSGGYCGHACFNFARLGPASHSGMAGHAARDWNSTQEENNYK